MLLSSRYQYNQTLQEEWQGPADTRYHVQLVHWTIVFAQSDAKQDKKGRFYESADYGWINELVATPMVV